LEEDNLPPSNDSDEHCLKCAQVDDDNNDNNDNNTNSFCPTNANPIVDYPTKATLKDSQDGLETQFKKIKHSQEHACMTLFLTLLYPCQNQPHQQAY